MRILMLLALSVGMLTAGESLPVGSTVVELQVAPTAVDIRRATEYAQLLVTAKLSSGATADVTRMVSISGGGEFLQISPTGMVRAKGDGSGELVLALGDKSARVPVKVSGFAAPLAVDYIRDCMPVLSKAGCNQGTCHGSKEGKAGFKLSLRGYDPIYDVRAFTDDAKGRRTNVASPDDSLMLLKATGAVPHEGQQVMSPDGDYYRILRAWIADGAKLKMDTPRVTKIELSPIKPVVQQIGAKQQIRVVATYADGLVKDVTAEAFIDSGNLEVLTADKAGLTTAVRRGEAPILARFEGNYASTVVTVMGDRTGFVWEAPPVNNEIDRFVLTKLQRMQTAQSGLCTDEEFVRRVYLDLTGLPPLAEDVRAFLADKRDTRWKREALIDRLIGSEDWIEQWSNKWADLLQVNSKFLGGEGAKLFRDWIRAEVKANTPYDQFVRKIITATGSNKANPPASYFKILREPAEIMENTTHLFLATRFNCNKCHDHPFERWTQDQYYEMTAYFARVGLERDPDSGDRNIGGTAVEGAKPLFEKVVDNMDGETKHDRTGALTPPKFPYKAQLVSLPASPAAEPKKPSRREELANWITSADNEYFAKSFTNRIFGYLTGTGLIEPLDDIRAGNPASNPELLDWLTKQFVDSGFDVRALMKLICQSRVYQLSITTNKWNEDDDINYSHGKVRRLPAETLYDAIYRATGSVSNIPGMPAGTRAAALQDSQTKLKDGFLTNLGRPVRESACECERSSDLQMGPIMALISGPTVGDALSQSGNAISRLASEVTDDTKLVQEMFLRFLGREATEGEVKSALETLHAQAAEQEQLVAAVKKRESEIAPARLAMEQQRTENVAKSKNELDQYQAELAPKIAAAEKARLDNIAAAEKAVNDQKSALVSKQAEWEKSQKGQTGWSSLVAGELTSTKPKSVLKQEADLAIFAETEGKQDLTIVTETTAESLTGLRLEALTDARIPANGPGRSGMGNFVLTEFEAFVTPAVGADWKLVKEFGFDAAGQTEGWTAGAASAVEAEAGNLKVKIQPNSRKSAITGPLVVPAGSYIAEFRLKSAAKLNQRLYWTTQKDFAAAELRSAAPLAMRKSGEFTTVQFAFTTDSESLGLKLQTDTANVEFLIDSVKIFAGKPAAEEKIKFSDARATFSQGGFEVKKAIDGNGTAGDNGWAVYPDGVGKQQTALFVIQPPLVLPAGGGRLRIVLKEQYPDGKHILGKFRLSATSAAGELNFGLPEAVANALAVAGDQRNDAQKAAVQNYFQSSDVELQKRSMALAEASKPLAEDPKLLELKQTLAKFEAPVPPDAVLERLKLDSELSKQQLSNPRLTGAQDLGWALINSPAFLFNR